MREASEPDATRYLIRSNVLTAAADFTSAMIAAGRTTPDGRALNSGDVLRLANIWEQWVYHIPQENAS